MKKLTVLVALFFGLALSGCNTTAGFGKDVQKVGNKIESAAENCQSGRTC